MSAFFCASLSVRFMKLVSKPVQLNALHTMFLTA